MRPIDHVTTSPTHPGTPADEARGPTREADLRDAGASADVTAGRALVLAAWSTVGDAIDAIRRRADGDAAPYYIYVTGPDSKLVGVVSMRDIVLARPHTPLSRVMRRDVVTVGAADDREDVARVFRRHGYLALPVVDSGARLVGVVTADDVMNAIEAGATDDVQRMFGAGPEERLTSAWHFSYRKRLPWLLVNLALATAGASVIGGFEGTLGAWTVLAMYMPIVAGMGGNASAQAMAIAIRGIAVGDARRQRLRRVIARELKIGVASGLVTGSVTACIAMALHGEHGPLLGLLVGVSLLINHTVACAWGAAIPFVMKSLGFDPAQSATIFTTTLTDAVGFFTLLGLAALSLRLL